jgi:hypothetical protein
LENGQEFKRKVIVTTHHSNGLSRRLVLGALAANLALPAFAQAPASITTPDKQSYPIPAAVPSADGSTTVYFSPTKPAGMNEGNWIQTDPTKAGTRCSAFTARWRRSSQNNGGRARSSWFGEAFLGGSLRSNSS